jgi:soluble lytic murein transglycosylase-like protein
MEALKFSLYKIPALKASFYTDAQVATNVKPIISRIKASAYYPKVIAYSNRMGMPVEFLVAIIGTESGGNNVGENSFGAIGLTQMTRATAYDTILKEVKLGFLMDFEKDYIKKMVPALKTKNFAIKAGVFEGLYPVSRGSTIWNQLGTALKDPEFNIFMSSMRLSQLAYQFRDSQGVPQLHKVLGRYNGTIATGERVAKYKNAWDAASASDVPTETRNYIKKVLGVNGFLDVMTR